MNDWITELVGEQYAPWVMFAMVAIALLLGLLIIRAIWRMFSGGTYIGHGKDRKRRLAVIDAAAVDNRRRLVLVRRDNVEHLILIGGHNDVVIETDILLEERSATPVQTHKRTTVAERPAPLAPAPRAAEPPRKPAPAPEPVRVEEPAVAAPSVVRQAAPVVAAATVASTAVHSRFSDQVAPVETVHEPEPPATPAAFEQAPLVETATSETGVQVEPEPALEDDLAPAVTLNDYRGFAEPDVDFVFDLQDDELTVDAPEPQFNAPEEIEPENLENEMERLLDQLEGKK